MSAGSDTERRTPAAFLDDTHPRSEWRSGPCRALGHCFEVLSEAAECSAALEPVVRSLRVGRATGTVEGRYTVRAGVQAEHRYTLFYGEERLASGRDPHEIVGVLAWHINHTVIETSVSSYVLLHAAAARRAGISVALIGDQESGKTTTVGGLLRRGYDYVTDEALALDPHTGCITPFPKALSVDIGAWPLFPECRPRDLPDSVAQWQVPAHHLGAAIPLGVLPAPRVVVFPQYRRGASTEIVNMTRADALLRMARLSFSFPDHARRNMQLLSRLVARATVARLVIGSLDEAVDAVDQLVSSRLLEDL